MRVLVARGFISFGMWLLPADVRKLVRGMMMFHVPGALTDEEKDEVIAAKSAWSRSRASAIRAAGAEKTAESGNSPSTHNSASE